MRVSQKSDDISWSSSDSDCDILPSKHQTRMNLPKIHRKKYKKKPANNLNNLDVTITPTFQRSQEGRCKSPVLTPKVTIERAVCGKEKEKSVITLKRISVAVNSNEEKSRCESALYTPKVTAVPALNLFINDKEIPKTPTETKTLAVHSFREEDRCISPVLTPKQIAIPTSSVEESLQSVYKKGHTTKIENDRQRSLQRTKQIFRSPSPVIVSKIATETRKHRPDNVSFACENRISPQSLSRRMCRPRSVSPTINNFLTPSRQNEKNGITSVSLFDFYSKEVKPTGVDLETLSEITSPIINVKTIGNIDTSPILSPQSTRFSPKSCRKNLMIKLSNSKETNTSVKTSMPDKLSPSIKTKRMCPDFTSPPSEALSKRIKSYFDSHFSSQSISQVSIHNSSSQSQIPASQIEPADSGSQRTLNIPIDVDDSSTPTPESSGNIITVSSEKTSTKPSISDVSPTSKVSVPIKTDSNDILTKKRRYKKNGLANRLQILLKKQRNQLSLWQHEMYLASNSNFVVPSSTPFRFFAIKKMHHHHESYLVEVVELSTELEYLVLLSLNFDCSTVVMEKSILKLYEPYEMIERGSLRIIIKACKFECIHVKDEDPAVRVHRLGGN